MTDRPDTDTLRARLIDDDIDNLTLDQIDAIATACWDDFQFIARRFLGDIWANDADVWDEAADRGYLDDDTTTD
jgi:hypothetical protein